MILSFSFFFLPGLPKDLLTYVAGLTYVPPLKFFLLATGARLPALFGSVIIGANIQEQDYLTAALLMAGALFLFLVGYFYKDRIIDGLYEWSAARAREEARKKRISGNASRKNRRLFREERIAKRRKGGCLMEKVIQIEGMSCQHCVGHVEAALGQVAGVRKVRVDLSQKKATVELDGTVPDEKLKAAVEDMGYDVIAIREND